MIPKHLFSALCAGMFTMYVYEPMNPTIHVFLKKTVIEQVFTQIWFFSLKYLKENTPRFPCSWVRFND